MSGPFELIEQNVFLGFAADCSEPEISKFRYEFSFLFTHQNIVKLNIPMADVFGVQIEHAFAELLEQTEQFWKLQCRNGMSESSL